MTNAGVKNDYRIFNPIRESNVKKPAWRRKLIKYKHNNRNKFVPIATLNCLKNESDVTGNHTSLRN